MGRSYLRVTLVLLVLACSAHAAFGDLRKLDPRARTALARLRAGATPEQMLESRMAVNRAGELDVFIRGQMSRQELEAAGARVRTWLPGLCTAYLPAGAVEAVAGLAGVEGIRGAAPVELELDASVPTTGVSALRGPGPTFAGLNGAGVLVGDVDTGVDYHHGDFDDAAGNTRLTSIWDQNDVTGPAPAPFAYGTDWTQAQINANTSTQTDLVGHGTHVLGIAGGDGSQTGGAVAAYTYVGMAPRADLVMVNTNFQDTGILDGVSYIFQVATTRLENAVANLSLGSHFGPHDGTDPFESGLSAMTGPGRVIVKSAGNKRGQARHADVNAAGLGTNVTMLVSGSAVGRLYAIDGYYEATENVNVQITTPNGTVIAPLTRGSINAAYPGTSTPNGNVYLENGAATTATGDYEVYVEVNVVSGQNMNGTWTFRFIPVALGAANGEVDLWRFFSSTGVTANFVTGNSPSQELISEPGNAAELITVAASVSKQSWIDCNGNSVTFTGTPAAGNLAPFSSPGPTRDGRQKPDICAPGDAIASATSFDTSPVCPVPPTLSTLLGDGVSHVINAGTSMAAPHVTGAVALLMQKYGALTPLMAKYQLMIHDKVDGFTGAVWNKDWGFGKLFLGTASDPLVDVVSPNGGEYATIGTSFPLQWSASDPALVSAGAEAAAAVTSVDLKLTRNNGTSYETIATGIANTGSYSWTVTGPATGQARLSVIAHDGSGNIAGDLSANVFLIGAAVGVDHSAVPEFGLGQAVPNPTSKGAQVEFAVPRVAPIKVAVLDIQGRSVATLAEGVYRPGRYQATWNGQSGARSVPAGLYFIRYRTPDRDLVRRVIVAH